MKQIFAFSIGLLLYLSCKSQQPFYSTLKAEGINGKVKMVERRRYKTDSTTNILINTNQYLRLEYNEDGNLIIDRTYDNNVFLYGRLISYHPNGLTKKIEFIDKDNKVTSTEEYDINPVGKYTGGRGFQEDMKPHRTFKIASQNEFGQWTQLDWYELDGELRRSEEFTYQGNRLMKMQWKDKMGKVIREEIRTYNNKGELVQTRASGGNMPDINSNRRVDAYDDMGNVTQYTIVKADGTTSAVYKTSYSYW